MFSSLGPCMVGRWGGEGWRARGWGVWSGQVPGGGGGGELRRTWLALRHLPLRQGPGQAGPEGVDRLIGGLPAHIVSSQVRLATVVVRGTLGCNSCILILTFSQPLPDWRTEAHREVLERFLYPHLTLLIKLLIVKVRAFIITLMAINHHFHEFCLRLHLLH